MTIFYTSIYFPLQLSNLNLTPQQKSLLNYDSEADMCCDDEEITPELTSTQDEYVTSTAAELRSKCI